MKNIIGYYRVSTVKQEQSGLGEEGQLAALSAYRKEHGGRILSIYHEVESGKIADRPELLKALAHAKRSQAVLVVAKLDRLSRNVNFISQVMDSGVEFVACDQPFASRLTLHILAAIAEHEAKQISERTKAALHAYKERGGVLGGADPRCNNLTQANRLKGNKHSIKVNAERARQAYSDLLPMMIECRQSGMTLQQIADQLNSLGHTTRQGKAWGQVQVGRVLAY
ncbi:MAG: recombinase family protein [Thermoguttaceae bacterium]|jgi:DNA invertase Pin-like site-specific DNA recombinase